MFEMRKDKTLNPQRTKGWNFGSCSYSVAVNRIWERKGTVYRFRKRSSTRPTRQRWNGGRRQECCDWRWKTQHADQVPYLQWPPYSVTVLLWLPYLWWLPTSGSGAHNFACWQWSLVSLLVEKGWRFPGDVTRPKTVKKSGKVSVFKKWKGRWHQQAGMWKSSYIAVIPKKRYFSR